MTVLGSLGIVRHAYIPKPNPFDVIPVDIVSNGSLVATAFHGDDAQTEPLAIYNCSTSTQNPLTSEGYKDVCVESCMFTQINGQVIRPMSAPHFRNEAEYLVRKFLGQ